MRGMQEIGIMSAREKLKEAVRFVTKIVGGLAALIFLRGPFSDSGIMLMEISVLIGLACFGAYTWAEPDVDISDIVSPPRKDGCKR